MQIRKNPEKLRPVSSKDKGYFMEPGTIKAVRKEPEIRIHIEIGYIRFLFTVQKKHYRIDLSHLTLDGAWKEIFHIGN